jgi:hypothetical protein
MGDKARNEVNVSAQPVEFGHAYRAALTARFSQGRSKLWTSLQGVAALTCLDLHKHAHKLEAFRLGEPRERFLLRLNAEP